jgi:hypothetical protein
MARVGEEFPLQCPACGGDIRLISFITAKLGASQLGRAASLRISMSRA